MTWRTLTDAQIAALIGTRIDIVAFDVTVTDDDRRREVVA